MLKREVSFVILLVILANKKRDLIIFNQKFLSIDSTLPKLEDLNKKMYHSFSLLPIKWRSLLSCNILKLSISRASDFNFDNPKNILFSQRLIRKHWHFLPVQNKIVIFHSLHPDVSNGKANISSWQLCLLQCLLLWQIQPGEKNQQSSRVFRTINFITFLSIIPSFVGHKTSGWRANFLSNGSSAFFLLLILNTFMLANVTGSLYFTHI